MQDKYINDMKDITIGTIKNTKKHLIIVSIVISFLSLKFYPVYPAGRADPAYPVRVS